MKFTVSAKDIFTKLKLVSMVTPGTGLTEGLEGVVFEIREGVADSLLLTATDSENYITSMVPISGGTPGVFAVNPLVLISLLAYCGSSPCTFVVEHTYLTVYCGTGMYTVPLYKHVPMMDKPEMPEVSTLTVDNVSFLKGLTETSYASGSDEFRPIFSGVRIGIASGQVYFAATDIYRIAEYSTTTGVSEDGEIVLPTKGVKILLSMVKPVEGVVNIAYNDKNAVFESGGTTVVCRTIVGKYPDYKGLFPGKVNFNCRINSDELLPILKSVTAFSGLLTKRVDVRFSAGNVKVIAGDFELKRKAEWSMDCECNGDETVAFKSNFLIDCLSKIPGMINVGVINAKIGVVFSSETDTTRSVIIPMVVQ